LSAGKGFVGLVTLSGMQRKFLAPAVTLACALVSLAAVPNPGGAAAVPAATTLRCADSIGTANSVPRGYSVQLARLALPTGRLLTTSPSGLQDPNARLFAKHGLLVKPGKAADLIVPDAWKGRLSIAWGSPAPCGRWCNHVNRFARLRIRRR